jgi:indolepyruvate ferredoxin oxidoreductase alpha subunit
MAFAKLLLSGNEAVGLAALHAGVALGCGYPGTPSTEILEYFSSVGGRAQWAPNEKVAVEVALGASYAGARTISTMKHVGLNVAADPLFTAAYTGVTGACIVVSADDPGMSSSQNEQDNRRYAVAAAVPMVEPSDSQESYDFTLAAIELSEKFNIPFLLRMTTRVCHSTTIVAPGSARPAAAPNYVRDVQSRVVMPINARPAHKRLRKKLADLAAWGENCPLNRIEPALEGDGKKLGIITSGISYVHAREAAPEASILKLGLTHPLPINLIRKFVQSVHRCVVIEEGDPYLTDAIRAAGLTVEGRPEMFRFGELNVDRVRRILAGDTSPEPAPPSGKPPELCPGCPHRISFEALRDLGCIVTGDIGCYTLGVMPPFNAMDTCVCMGAGLTVGLGLRHVLPDEQAAKVVGVLGDSTFMHSGLTGLVDMVYNPPKTGFVLMILDNGITAMTGLQEHPGSGRTLDHKPANRVVIEDVVRAIGVKRVFVIDLFKDGKTVKDVIRESLDARELTVIIARRPCLLAAKRIREFTEQQKISR